MLSIHSNRAAGHRGFNLLEVMIAIGLFFMVAFAILALVSQSLRQARALEFTRSPVGSLASQTVLTNELEEGFETGDFDDVFPDYNWTREVFEFGTNGLYEVELTVSRNRQSEPEGTLNLLMFRPDTGAPRRGRVRRR